MIVCKWYLNNYKKFATSKNILVFPPPKSKTNIGFTYLQLSKTKHLAKKTELKALKNKISKKLTLLRRQFIALENRIQKISDFVQKKELMLLKTPHASASTKNRRTTKLENATK